ncbi:hypothetical protein H2200_007770 [Cladophialophora chaetospira]|uniref:C2H2-type domain-containing protein n=1 Tax=Cladophialophora chaetospira TaxID=386627 RepID=A0AA39CGS7_9EURO|nr:hypothetical protein H2200_007770 [Cladophialophora chaetospira]
MSYPAPSAGLLVIFERIPLGKNSVCGDSSIPPKVFMEPLLEDQDDFFPISAESAGTGCLNRYVVKNCHETSSTADSVMKNVKLLVDLGLNREQIWKLCQHEYVNALNLLADTEGHELDQAVHLLQQRQPGSRLHSLRLSGVLSLVSDRSSLRASTASDFSVSMQISNFIGSEYYQETHAPDISYPYSREMHCTPAESVVNTIGMPITEEDQCWQEFNFQMPDPLNLCLRPRSIETGPDPYIVSNQLAFPAHRSRSSLIAQIQVGGHSVAREPEQDLNRYQKPTFPCSENDCSKTFSSDNEFSKHLTGDHDRDVKFMCTHANCPSHPYETSRIEMWKRHHIHHHRGCLRYETCKKERHDRGQRNYWACGLCEELNTDVKSYAKHHKSHFSDGRIQQKVVDFSIIMRNLLRQNATNNKWMERNVDRQYPDGTFLLSWEAETSADLREALEYGVFQRLSIDQTGVVDRLLDEVIARARHHRKRPASSSPTREDLRHVSSLSFQNRLLSRDEHQQLRAGTISALEQIDVFDAGDAFDAFHGEL